MSSLDQLLPHLHEIISKFYKEMLSHKQLSIFFTDQEQIDRIIEKQKQNFIDSLKDNDSQFEERFLRLGELHYDLRVPSTDFLKSTSIWRRNFIDYALKEVKNTEMVLDIDDYFNKVNTLMSKGYLTKQLKVDKKDIKNLIHQYESNEHLRTDAALSHLQWLNQILIAIENSDISMAPELDIDKCTIHNQLKEPPEEMLSLFNKEHFDDLHQRLHIDARSLFYFVEKNDYLEALSLYSNLLSVYKITLITIGNLNLQQTVVDLEKSLAEKNDKLIIAYDEAVRANKAKSDFLAAMSHELRTPLNSILGFSQLMEMEVEDPETKDYITEIKQAGDYLLNIVNEILDISQIESGKIELRIEPIDLNEIVSECISIIRHSAEERSICIENNINNMSKYNIHVDEIRFKQIILNLLSNAVKYNKHGGKIVIDSSLNKDKNNLCISITDTGNGLSQEQQDNLFKPFSRVGAEHTNIEGTGLGLSISKELIELMHGSIGVKSEISQGSTFWVEVHLG